MKKKFEVKGMTCAACQRHVENTVSKIEGVTNCEVSLLSNSISLDFDENISSIQQIAEAVSDIGYELVLQKKEVNEKDTRVINLIITSVLLLILMYVSMSHMFDLPLPFSLGEYENSLWFTLVQLFLSLPILIIYRIYFINGFKRLFLLAPNMDSLICLSASASMIYGIVSIVLIGYGLSVNDVSIVNSYRHNLYFESASMVLVLVSLGKYFESLSKNKTTEALGKLMDLSPKKATVLKDDKEIVTLIEDINVGDVVIVKQGNIVPVDGLVIEGEASIDQANITGENMPVYKKVDDSVFASTTLLSGYIKVKTSKKSQDSSIQTIINLVEEASNSKAPISRLVDKISGVFVPIVLVISILSFIVHLLISGDFELALNFALSILVIACPCALGLATPVAIMVGTGKAAELGLIVKNAEVLEKVNNIKTIVLDKTGTITEGKPAVTDIIKLKGEDFIIDVISIESLSSHPLVNALNNYKKEHNIELKEVRDFRNIEGRGVSAKINDDVFFIGNYELIKDLKLDDEKLKKEIDNYHNQGKKSLICVKNNSVIGIILIKDKIKESSYKAIKLFKDRNIETIMLTGDNKLIADSIASEINIDKVYADVLPQEKKEIVKSLKRDDNHLVAMVGDGVNDALALMDSDLGISLGGGSDIAKDSSDIVLLRNDLNDIINIIDLSKFVLSTIKLNLFWAFFYNSIGILLASGVFYYSLGIKLNPMIGSLTMSISSLFVVLNALRINMFKSQNEIINKKENENMDLIEIKVEGMMCNRCKAHVEKAVLKTEGVEYCEVSLEKNTVTVRVKDNKVIDEIIKNIIEEGYEASL